MPRTRSKTTTPARPPGLVGPRVLGGPRARTIAAALEPWFLAHHRDLSWRRTRDPYAIWVSEIMLQQTRVDTVERYWSGFIARFPDVATLAAADTDEVLAAWSGLGYYRRARLLHAGARMVAAQLGAELPRDVEGLRQIPGIGAYTAGAIAAIAYDQPQPLVDGNVARVLSRLEGETTPAQQGATAPWLWDACAAILRSGTPRVLGQALMELGATVCTPAAPRCDACPLLRICRAHADGVTADIPAPRVRAAVTVERWRALAVVHDDAVLLVRRGDAGLLARMWSLPMLPRAPGDAVPARTAVTSVLAGRLGGVRVVDATVVHVFTHRRWELRIAVVPVRTAVRPRGDEPHVWLRAGERPPGGLPTLARKLLDALHDHVSV